MLLLQSPVPAWHSHQSSTQHRPLQQLPQLLKEAALEWKSRQQQQAVSLAAPCAAAVAAHGERAGPEWVKLLLCCPVSQLSSSCSSSSTCPRHQACFQRVHQAPPYQQQQQQHLLRCLVVLLLDPSLRSPVE